MGVKIMKNKRGDIPITILVIGVLAICITAILSFSLSSKSSKNDFSTLDTVEEVLVIKEKISLYSKLGFSEEEIIKILGIQYDENLKTKYILRENGPVIVRYNLP